MAKKSAKAQVKEDFPLAEYVGMGVPGLMTHTIYKDSTWKQVLGQSLKNQSDAWFRAARDIKSAK